MPSRVVASVLWDVDVDICQALEREPAHDTCPPECTYVPTGIRDWLLTWEHTAVVTGHLGITRTIQSISGKYWWPTLVQDVTRYVNIPFRMCPIQIPPERSSREAPSPSSASVSLVSYVH